MPARRKRGRRPNPYTPNDESWPAYEAKAAQCGKSYCVNARQVVPQGPPWYGTGKPVIYRVEIVDSYNDAIRSATQYANNFSAANRRNPNPARVLNRQGHCITAFLGGQEIGCENPLSMPRIPHWQEIPQKTKLIAAGALIAGLGILLLATTRKKAITTSRFGQEVLARAQRDVGVTETDGSGRVGQMLLTYGITYPVNWCAVATGTWIHEAAKDFGIKPPIPGSPGAKDTMLQFQNASNKKVDWLDADILRKYPELVQPGMIPVWQRGPTDSFMGHIGVVEANLGNGNFQSIEGNSGPGAGAVLRNQRSVSTDNFLGMGYFNDAEVFKTDPVGVAGMLSGPPELACSEWGNPTIDTVAGINIRDTGSLQRWAEKQIAANGSPCIAYYPSLDTIYLCEHKPGGVMSLVVRPCLDGLPKAETVAVTFNNGSSVKTEVVRTPEDQARGLMYRMDMPQDEGMLFVYPTESSSRALWMRNTFIPLDGIFFNAAGVVVGIVENLVPHSDQVRGVSKPVQYILETNAGWAKSHGVRVGSRLSTRIGVGYTQDPPGILKFE